MHLSVPLILASRSPRRRQLLERIGVGFTVHISPTEEVLPEGLPPEAIVRQLAWEKAEPVAAHHPQALTLGADTVVVLDGAVLGKPADAAEAHAMLRRLAGRTHTVYTGLALLHPATGRTLTTFEATDVTFGPMTDAEIAGYIASGAPMDKAGAYGIQDDRGALFIQRIDGDYYNVVGLPLHRLYQTLKAAFGDLLHAP